MASASADLEGLVDTSNLFEVIDRHKWVVNPFKLRNFLSFYSYLQQEKLISFYLESSVHGLNLTVPEDAKEIIKPWDGREDNSKYLDSSVDDQVCFVNLWLYSILSLLIFISLKLIIHVPFMQNVRIRSVLLKLGE